MDIGELSFDSVVRTRATAAGLSTNVWPLMVDRKRGLVAVQPRNLLVILPDGTEHRYAWDDIEDLELEEHALRIRPTGQDTPIRYALEHRLHGKRIREAISAAGGPITPPPSSTNPLQWPTEAPATPRSASGSATRTSSSAKLAGSRLTNLFIGGIAIQVVAGIIIALAWPGTTVDYVNETTEDTGSQVGLLLGIALAWAGAVLIQIAVIGWGVMIGNKASDKAP